MSETHEAVGQVLTEEAAAGGVRQVMKIVTRMQARLLASSPLAGDTLFALQAKPFYEGTVPAHVKAKRRAQNKRAKASRKANR